MLLRSPLASLECLALEVGWQQNGTRRNTNANTNTNTSLLRYRGELRV